MLLLLENIAKGKMTFQSSTHWPGKSSTAVDGNTDTNFGSGSCTHTTNVNEINPWWMVDLGNAANVYRVEVTNRDPACKFKIRKCTEEYYIEKQ